MRKILVAGLVCLVIFGVSCERESEDEDEYGRSHNAGKNCLSCHSEFKLAGSVYNKSFNASYPGAKIKVTSQANGGGSVLVSLTSDNSGNFHTGNSVNFGSGVYVSVEGTTGTVKYINAAITSGACNSGNESSASKIWAE